MRGTTIFRSNLLPILAALVVTSGVAQAQDTTQVVPRDTTPVVQGQAHVVQTGETLWSLAEQYLGDALLWPAIYRLNTLVVEDPHWIFPGEELRLVSPDSTMLAPGAQPVAQAPGGELTATTQGIAGVSDTIMGSGIASGAPVTDTSAVAQVVTPGVSTADLPPPPPPPGEGSPTLFAPRARSTASAVAARRTRNLRAFSSTDFYSAGFLTENDVLPWADVVGALGKPQLGDLSNMTSARIFESIVVRAPQAATYQVGDTLLVAMLGREVPSWGRVVVPTGIARVRESSGGRVVADVLTQYGRVVTGQVAMPVEPFRNPGLVFPAAIDNGMAGRIITVRDVHALPGDLNIVFLDRGREDGLTPGDIFEVLRPNPPEASPETPLQQVALLQVVHVRQKSASAMLIQITSTGVQSGAPVRLIRKMPS